MSKKGKSHTNPMAELHFVADVQLEEAVMMLGDIADKEHKVTLREVSENEFKFRMNYLPNSSPEAEIWGTLQRWQGTETKIDASGYVLRLSDTDNNEKSNEYTGIIVVGFLFLFGLTMISRGSWLFGLPFIIIALVMLFALSWYTPNIDEKATVSFRARDYLLQRIIDTFKIDEDVEIYVPEISRQEQRSGKS